MRILHTANTYAPALDGVAEVVRHISQGLALRGHEVHVATHAFPSQPVKSLVNGVHVHRFCIHGNWSTGMTGSIREYREFVSSGKWDLVVHHCLQAWPTDALLETIPTYPWPVLLVTHGLGTNNPVFADYYRFLPSVMPQFAAWVTISALSEEFAFAKRNGLATPHVIQNGVDLQEWAKPILGVRKNWNANGRPWLVNVSNHSRQKGHERLHKLMSRMRNTRATLTIIGDSRRADKWRLGRLGINGGCFYQCRARTMVSKSVDLKIRIPREEVVSAIKEADLLVSTSRWEANSVVLIESMAAGTPWVSLDVGSARENAGGVVVRSVDEMAEVVAGLLRDPERRSRLGQEGRLRVAERHDWRSIVSRYEDLYLQVCTKSERRVCVGAN